jgi:arylsulfatase
VSGSASNVALWSNPVVQARPTKRFNVVFLLEDALRADYLSAYGFGLDTSPNKNALMRERGIQFDWAISQAPKTRPSVPSLMTSLYPTATGVWHFTDMLSEQYLTLAEIMRRQGFVTASFIQNGNAGPYAGLHQGFSQLLDENVMGSATENVLGGRVLSWLERNRDQNFFLYIHAIDPHGPYAPSAPFDNWYKEAEGQGTPVKRGQLDPDWVKKPTVEGRQRRYAGEIRHNDALLPQLLRKMDSLGLSDDTLLVLLSDHGEYMGEHGRSGHDSPGRAPVIRVPLMMSYPKQFTTPKRLDAVVQLVDVMPTILELAGVDRSGLLLQGDSLVDLIAGNRPGFWRDRVAVSEEPDIMLKQRPCTCASLFFRDWHVISSVVLWPGRTAGFLPQYQAPVKTLVYAFRDDPGEVQAVRSFLPDLYVRWAAYDVLSELQGANMTTWRKLTGGEGVDLRLDPATLEHLHGLGYVQ